MKKFYSTLDMFYDGFNPYKGNPLENLTGKNLIFFDTETVGLNPYMHQLLEIAAVAKNSNLETVGVYHKKISLSSYTIQKMEHN